MSRELYYDRLYHYLRHRPLTDEAGIPASEFEESNNLMLAKLRATNVIVAPFTSEECDEIEKLNINDFKFDMPYDNFFIETAFKDRLGRSLQFSIFCYREDEHDWCLSVGTTRDNDFKNFLELSSIIRTDLFPRFYVLCRRHLECEQRIVPRVFGEIGKLMCQSTARLSTPDIGCQMRSLMHSGLQILMYVVQRINNPKLLKKERKVYVHNTGQSRGRLNERHFSYLGREYVYTEKKDYQGGHHASPVPHDRRGHVRHYRDKVTGQVIKEVPVRSSKIHGGAEERQKFYILKGGN